MRYTDWILPKHSNHNQYNKVAPVSPDTWLSPHRTGGSAAREYSTMKKVLKYLVIATALTVGLTFMPQTTHDVYARYAIDAGIPGGGGDNSSNSSSSSSSPSGLDVATNANGEGTGRKATGKGSGGASRSKSGFFVTVSYADGVNGAPTAIGHGCVLKCKNGQAIPSAIGKAVGSQSRIPGATVGANGVSPWSCEAFNLDSGVGFGGTVKSFLAANGPDGSSHAIEIASKYCGVPKEKILELQAQGKTVFVNCEPLLWHDKFSNLSGTSSTGALIGGLTYGVGQQVGDSSNFTTKVDREAFPASFRYQEGKTWQQIQPCSDMGRFPSSVMMNKKVGCGIVSVKLTSGYQLVIVCEDKSTGTCVAEYSSCGAHYDVLPVYNGYTFVEGCSSNKKTTLTDPAATYPQVKGSGAPNRDVGTGGFDFQPKEEALFLHYVIDAKQAMPIMPKTQLYSWETAYVMPNYLAKRLDGTAPNHGYCVADYVQEKIDAVRNMTPPSCPENGSYERAHAHGGDAKVVIDDIRIDGVSYGTGDGWKSAKYFITADLGAFPHASWNLYRPGIQYWEKWKKFSEALNNKIWVMTRLGFSIDTWLILGGTDVLKVAPFLGL